MTLLEHAATTTAPTPAATSVSIAAALNQALRDALADDPNVVIFGEDVGPLGGVFRITDKLSAEFGESRVWDSPLAEAGIVGTAIGMAMYGMRPVVEMQFDAFSYPAFEQITSHLAKMHNRTKGRVSLPIVIRIPYAGDIGGVEHHSDSSEAYWTHTPGLTVVTPSNAADAYSMLREAIASDDPVIFLEPKSRYWSKDSVILPAVTAPMNQAVALREGTDVTLLAYGPTVKTALRAAELGAQENLSVEVVDLRSLSPFDDATVGTSVRKTSRAAVIHEAAQFGGYGAEVAARVTEREFFHLAAPILRITGFDIPYPSPKLEEHYLPTAERVLAALDKLGMVIAVGEQFLLPDLGEGLTEAEIVAWLVAPGDIIAVDQLVVEVESAKSVVELPSPFGGRVESLHAGQGDMVAKGSPLLTVVPESESESESGSGAVLVGYGTRENTVRLSRPESGRFGRSGARPPVSSPSPVVSPLVRKLARDHELDATRLAGSGPGSLVTRADVEAAIANTLVPAGGTEDLRIPITGLRKVAATRLAHSRRVIPEATIWLDVDATELFTAKRRLESVTGEKFGITALIARFAVAGLARYPILNSSVDDESNEIVQHGAVNLGLAAQTPRGLLVPVVHGAGELTTRQLRDRIAELTATSATGSFGASALSGGTFTLNNYGSFGVDGSAPIINHPEVAMLGIGRIIDRPWVVDGELAVRKVAVLSFAFDHRVCDGDVASGFLTYVARCMQDPVLLFADL